MSGIACTTTRSSIAAATSSNRAILRAGAPRVPSLTTTVILTVVAPSVSVVVPVFNGMPHLAHLVDSLLVQDYPDVEFVFSDGGSTDGSPAFLASVSDPRVRVVAPRDAHGAAKNWTAATEAARGDLIKLVCQDDLLYPRAISHQVTDLINHPNAVMAVAQRDIVDANGGIVYARRGGAGLQPGEIPGHVAIHTCWERGTNVLGEPVAVMFRRQPMLNALPWDDSNPLVLDLMFYEKVTDQGAVVFRKESIGAFRVSTSSWSTRLASVQKLQFEKWQQDYEARQFPPLSVGEIRRARLALVLQTTLRRGAYTWLRWKGSLSSRG